MKSLPDPRHTNGLYQGGEIKVDAAISLPSLLKGMNKSNYLNDVKVEEKEPA
jgi:hypothetical protein